MEIRNSAQHSLENSLNTFKRQPLQQKSMNHTGPFQMHETQALCRSSQEYDDEQLSSNSKLDSQYKEFIYNRTQQIGNNHREQGHVNDQTIAYSGRPKSAESRRTASLTSRSQNSGRGVNLSRKKVHTASIYSTQKSAPYGEQQPGLPAPQKYPSMILERQDESAAEISAGGSKPALNVGVINTTGYRPPKGNINQGRIHRERFKDSLQVSENSGYQFQSQNQSQENKQIFGSFTPNTLSGQKEDRFKINQTISTEQQQHLNTMHQPASFQNLGKLSGRSSQHSSLRNGNARKVVSKISGMKSFRAQKDRFQQYEPVLKNRQKSYGSKRMMKGPSNNHAESRNSKELKQMVNSINQQQMLDQINQHFDECQQVNDQIPGMNNNNFMSYQTDQLKQLDDADYLEPNGHSNPKLKSVEYSVPLDQKPSDKYLQQPVNKVEYHMGDQNRQSQNIQMGEYEMTMGMPESEEQYSIDRAENSPFNQTGPRPSNVNATGRTGNSQNPQQTFRQSSINSDLVDYQQDEPYFVQMQQQQQQPWEPAQASPKHFQSKELYSSNQNTNHMDSTQIRSSYGVQFPNEPLNDYGYPNIHNHLFPQQLSKISYDEQNSCGAMNNGPTYYPSQTPTQMDVYQMEQQQLVQAQMAQAQAVAPQIMNQQQIDPQQQMIMHDNAKLAMNQYSNQQMQNYLDANMQMTPQMIREQNQQNNYYQSKVENNNEITVGCRNAEGRRRSKSRSRSRSPNLVDNLTMFQTNNSIYEVDTFNHNSKTNLHQSQFTNRNQSRATSTPRPHVPQEQRQYINNQNGCNLNNPYSAQGYYDSQAQAVEEKPDNVLSTRITNSPQPKPQNPNYLYTNQQFSPLRLKSHGLPHNQPLPSPQEGQVQLINEAGHLKKHRNENKDTIMNIQTNSQFKRRKKQRARSKSRSRSRGKPKSIKTDKRRARSASVPARAQRRKRGDINSKDFKVVQGRLVSRERIESKAAKQQNTPDVKEYQRCRLRALSAGRERDRRRFTGRSHSAVRRPPNPKDYVYKQFKNLREILEYLSLKSYAHIFWDKDIKTVTDFCMLTEQSMKRLLVPQQARTIILSYQQFYNMKYAKTQKINRQERMADFKSESKKQMSEALRTLQQPKMTFQKHATSLTSQNKDHASKTIEFIMNKPMESQMFQKLGLMSPGSTINSKEIRSMSKKSASYGNLRRKTPKQKVDRKQNINEKSSLKSKRSKSRQKSTQDKRGGAEPKKESIRKNSAVSSMASNVSQNISQKSIMSKSSQLGGKSSVYDGATQQSCKTNQPVSIQLRTDKSNQRCHNQNNMSPLRTNNENRSPHVRSIIKGILNERSSKVMDTQKWSAKESSKRESKRTRMKKLLTELSQLVQQIDQNSAGSVVCSATETSRNTSRHRPSFENNAGTFENSAFEQFDPKSRGSAEFGKTYQNKFNEHLRSPFNERESSLHQGSLKQQYIEQDSLLHQARMTSSNNHEFYRLSTSQGEMAVGSQQDLIGTATAKKLDISHGCMVIETDQDYNSRHSTMQKSRGSRRKGNRYGHLYNADLQLMGTSPPDRVGQSATSSHKYQTINHVDSSAMVSTKNSQKGRNHSRPSGQSNGRSGVGSGNDHTFYEYTFKDSKQSSKRRLKNQDFPRAISQHQTGLPTPQSNDNQHLMETINPRAQANLFTFEDQEGTLSRSNVMSQDRQYQSLNHSPYENLSSPQSHENYAKLNQKKHNRTRSIAGKNASSKENFNTIQSNQYQQNKSPYFRHGPSLSTKGTQTLDNQTQTITSHQDQVSRKNRRKLERPSPNATNIPNIRRKQSREVYMPPHKLFKEDNQRPALAQDLATLHQPQCNLRQKRGLKPFFNKNTEENYQGMRQTYQQAQAVFKKAQQDISEFHYRADQLKYRLKSINL